MTVLEQIAQNSDNFIGRDDLAEKLSAGKTLRVKLGVDPT